MFLLLDPTQSKVSRALVKESGDRLSNVGGLCETFQRLDPISLARQLPNGSRSRLLFEQAITTKNAGLARPCCGPCGVAAIRESPRFGRPALKAWTWSTFAAAISTSVMNRMNVRFGTLRKGWRPADGADCGHFSQSSCPMQPLDVWTDRGAIACARTKARWPWWAGSGN
jgi:hypothetical protein